MKHIFFLMAALLVSSPAYSTGGSELFGVPIGEQTDDILTSMLYNLTLGNRSEARMMYDRLDQMDPELASIIDLDALRTPCLACADGQTEGRCKKCRGRKERYDPAAMAFLLNKVQKLMSSQDDLVHVWNAAMKEFNLRKGMMRKGTPFAGKVALADGDNGLVLQLEGGKAIYLIGVDHPQQYEPEQPLQGYMWGMGKQTHMLKKPRVMRLKKYTLNIWMDFQ